MVKLAFVFPGQGAQYVGMVQEIAAEFAAAREVFRIADQLLSYKVSELCWNGPEEMLNRTQYAQPALLTCSMAVYQVLLEKGIEADICAGLSLGEYSALVAAGYLDFAEALPLVEKRGSLMQAAVPEGQGGMAAVLGLSCTEVENVLSESGCKVGIANYNCPGQVVISGEKLGILEACRVLQEKGGRTKILDVSVPSHSPLMYEAALKFKPYLEAVRFKPGSIPVVNNADAGAGDYTQLPDILTRQLYLPVKWEQSVRYMMSQADYFIEVGPGSTLTGIIKRIDRSRILGNVDDLDSLERLAKEVDALGQ